MCQSFIELIVCKNGKKYIYSDVSLNCLKVSILLYSAITRRKDLAIQKRGDIYQIKVSSVVVKQKERKGGISSLYGIMSLLFLDVAHTTPQKGQTNINNFQFYISKASTFCQVILRFKVLLPTFCEELRKLPIPEVRNYRFATKSFGKQSQ